MIFPIDAQSLLHAVEEHHEIKAQVETFHQKPSVALVQDTAMGGDGHLAHVRQIAPSAFTGAIERMDVATRREMRAKQ